MRILFSFCLFVFSHGYSYSQFWNNKFIFTIEAINGGEKGFNETDCRCNSFKNEFIVVLKDTGYSPIECCCYDDFPLEVKELYKKLMDKIILNRQLSANLPSANYILTFNIQNSKNFYATITKK